MIIRPIEKRDNPIVKSIVVSVLAEYEASGEGYASADPELDNMFATYQTERSVFYVVVEGGSVKGCAGLAPLKGAEKEICELQKMYFLPELRGKGYASLLIDRCLEDAKKFGFTQCYLETLPNMVGAQALYKKVGFHYIHTRLGTTGHSKCEVLMARNL